MRSLVLAFAALLLTNCGGPYPPSDFDVYVLDATPHDWVNEATKEWKTFAGAHFRMHFPPGEWSCDGDCVLVSLAPDADVASMCQHSAIGCTDCARHPSGLTCKILLDESMGDAIGRLVTIHEFGHVLRLEHACADGHMGDRPCPRVTTAPTIMTPIVGVTAQHVTCDDLQQFNELRGYPPPACNDPRLLEQGPLDLP